MANEHDHILDAAVSLDETVAEKSLKQSPEVDTEAKGIPEDATEVPGIRDITAQRDLK